MNESLKFAFAQRATFVWLLLVVATGFSWFMGTSTAEEGAVRREILTAILIGVAMLKARFVIRVFMEVREATLALRVLMDVWCALVVVVVVTLLWGGS